MKTLLPQPKLTNKNQEVPLGLVCPARRSNRLRIPCPVLPPRPIFAGNPKFLRALRAAEMALWQATGGDFFRAPSAN